MGAGRTGSITVRISLLIPMNSDKTGKSRKSTLSSVKNREILVHEKKLRFISNSSTHSWSTDVVMNTEINILLCIFSIMPEC